MCGRYGFIPKSEEAFYKRYETNNRLDHLQESYNVAPTQEMPIITSHSPNEVSLMKWGLIPSWAKDPKIAYSTINARAEGIKEKPSFRGSLKNKRCLVPASGFYEWKVEGKEKIPYYFTVKDEDLISFAGLYDVWKDKDGREIFTYTIITTEANEVVSPVHPRMPVILSKEDEKLWVDNSGSDPEMALMLLKQFESKKMDGWRVSNLANSPRNNSSDLIKPI